jgi:hypothetical protein
MRLIRLKVFPNSPKRSATEKEDGSLELRFSAAPEKGKANKVVVEMASEFFGVSPSKVKIVKGLSSRNKLLSIDG